MATVLLLGATSDIALSTANKFASFGYDIQLASRKVERLQPTRSDLVIRFNVACTLYEFDALKFDQNSVFFESLNPKPDIVVCIFGYLGSQKLAEKDWQTAGKIINSNYSGAISTLNIFANYFSEQKKGYIVGVSSVAGERGKQSNYIYGSAKSGFTTYLSGLRNRLFKDHVHVVSVLPAFVYTKMTEEIILPKFLTAYPSEVANAIYKAVSKNKDVVYVKWFWRWIMLIIKLIPEFIFKRLKM